MAGVLRIAKNILVTKEVGVLALLLLAALFFRIPYLLNPERMNSDHAFLGLQSMRIFHGEWRWFLWESDYQASWEPLVGFVLFSLFGPHYSVLQAVPLVGFALCFLILYDIGRRELGVGKAAALCLLWVFASRPFVEYNVLPYRQWSLTFCLLSLWFAYSASRARRMLYFAAAGFFIFFALYVDFVTIQFTLPLLGYLALRTRTEKKYREAAVGVFCGVILLIGTRFLGPRGGAPLAFSIKTILHNTSIFFQTCLPVLLGFDYPETKHGAVRIAGVGWLQLFTSLTLVFLIAKSVRLSFAQSHRVPSSSKHLVWFGLALCLNSALGFLGSSMASDLHSVRYIPAILYSVPFLLFAAARVFSVQTLFATLSLFLLATAIGGWRQSKPFVEGAIPVRDPNGWVRQANEMGQWLKRKGVHSGFADYWIAYQLTFLYQEDPLIVPRDPVIDRYPLYRDIATKANLSAEIFTRGEPSIEKIEHDLRQADMLKEKWENEEFVVLIKEKT